MKNSIVLTCFILLANWSMAQGLLNNFSASFTLPTIAGPYEPEDELLFDYTLFNNSSESVTAKIKFELWQNGMLALEAAPADILVSASSNTNGSFSFQFPEACLLAGGDYTFRAAVNYAQTGTNAPITVSTFDGGFMSICDDQSIPIGGTSDSCVILLEDLTYLDDFSTCCTLEPNIVLTSTPAYPYDPPKFPLIRRSYVHAQVNFGSNPVSYTLEWSNGATGPTFIHDCGGTVDYYVTVTWEENGHVCSIVAGPVAATSHFACPHDGDPINPGGLGGLLGGRDPVKPSTSAPAPYALDAGLRIFPNPNQGQFQVSIPNAAHVTHLEVWNNLGQKVWQAEGAVSNTHALILPEVQTGVYLLRVRYDDATIGTQQFVIR
ncbi:MAG: T9SS type A sorting domain-containing protein [Bacteroidota bacterium]